MLERASAYESRSLVDRYRSLVEGSDRELEDAWREPISREVQACFEKRLPETAPSQIGPERQTDPDDALDADEAEVADELVGSVVGREVLVATLERIEELREVAVIRVGVVEVVRRLVSPLSDLLCLVLPHRRDDDSTECSHGIAPSCWTQRAA